jgi:methylenetetrahydrofolate dehydrogenase (NADP+)/methenyltetrahydrofolate cyclohydrolase
MTTKNPKLLRAAPVTDALYADLKNRVAVFRARSGRAPKLAVVLVGEDPASVIYTTKKSEMAAAIGIESLTVKLPSTVTPATVREKIDALNRDPSVDGILIQRPLPKTFSESEIVYFVTPEKDVDAFHPTNVGKLQLGLPCFKPCTPWGVMRLLKHYGIGVEGKLVAVVGRSSIVGKPMAALLLQANATVLQVHRKTKNMASLVSKADVVVAAAGHPELIQSKHLKKGAIVIDVGIHRVVSKSKSKIVGDVSEKALKSKAKAATPVPGGVGPMTIAILMENTVAAAEGAYRAP